ncbi:MAG TPA: hypothetical protein VL334_13110 [Anaerolineae bacterium]|nr:hypothetical protein [Anaerolineae bacterium]
MSTVVRVTFDGHSLFPESPVDLEPNGQYIITIEPYRHKISESSAWDVLEEAAGTVDAPADWAGEHDHYLYGTAKRGKKRAA